MEELQSHNLKGEDKGRSKDAALIANYHQSTGARCGVFRLYLPVEETGVPHLSFEARSNWIQIPSPPLPVRTLGDLLYLPKLQFPHKVVVRIK